MMQAPRTPSTPALALLAALAVFAASGCVSPAREADSIVFASGADLESANPLVTVHPLSRQVQRFMLLVTLARYGDSLQAEPYFARRWSWSADRRTLTLTVAGGVRWQDGAPTTARDAAFTIDAARDPATGYARYTDLADVRDVIARDDTTLAIAFVHSQPRFPAVLCELAIVPAHRLAGVPRATMRQAAFNRAPIGNGPFVFVSRRVGQRWVFERNAAFPIELGGPPTLRRVVIAVVDEPATKFAGLVSGDLDVAGISPGTTSLVRRDPALRVLDYPVLFGVGVVFNVKRAPFDDARVRRAISLSIDRRRIIDAALAGYGTPAGGAVPRSHPFGDSASAGRDSARADSLFTAAGWMRDANGRRARYGVPFAFDLLTVGSGDNAIEQLLQADLASLGVRMEIRQREMGAFLAAARAPAKTFDALLTGIPGDVSLAYLSSMFDSRAAGGALDYGGYHTPRLDSLLAAARTAPTDVEARAAWSVVQRELVRETPVAWIYHARGVQGLARRLDGVTMDLRGEMVSIARWSTSPRARVARR
ncbi:MAG: peptide ABC transporter substrate-binding protein [Gemmatimonadaceae bacterium]